MPVGRSVEFLDRTGEIGFQPGKKKFEMGYEFVRK